ncbi:mite allergen Der p 3-like [Brevipalpus obovatus]|uniref:mite allergen Der p 3-like n=1 Tax=Brevipalpus obovatus TaxID=246614 RepID=UPI003D9EE1B2
MALNFAEIAKNFFLIQPLIFFSQAKKATIANRSLDYTTSRSKPQPSLIVGGREAKDGEFPFIVALMDPDYPDLHLGAGTLLEPKWILTAQHMIVDKDNNMQTVELLVAPKYSNKISEMKGKKRYKVEKMFCHPVDLNMRHADIGLLKLREGIPLGMESSYRFQTISLLRSSNDIDWNKEMQIMGWGLSRHTWNPQPEDFPDHLMVLSTKLNPTEECKSIFEHSFRSPNSFCVGHEHKTGGMADSGGPAIMKRVRTNENIQVGVVSFGRGDARNVSYFYQWIQDRMNDENSKYECKNVYPQRKI